MNDKEEIDKLLYYNDNDVNYIQLYKQGNSDYLNYINHLTPRYHANMLFNQMIDYCIKNNYTLTNFVTIIRIQIILKKILK